MSNFEEMKADSAQNGQEKQNADESLQKSKSKRFNKCYECEEYYEQSNQESTHSCVEALRERIKQQQDQINNMITKEEMADILKGYIPHDAFLNFVRTSEKKFSELFHNVNSHEEMLKGNKKQEEINCPIGHKLSKLTGSRLQYVSCDLCNQRALDLGNHTMRCEACNFDICCACENNIYKIKCKNNHVMSLVKTSDYESLECDVCSREFSSRFDITLRCYKCDYDICETCYQTKVNMLKSNRK